MQIVIDIPDNMDLRNYNIPYDILDIITNGTPLSKNVEQAINRLHKHSFYGVVAMDYVEIVLKDVFDEVNADEKD